MKNLGLQIIDVEGDGNCLFRAISDQKDGHEDNHDYYRQKTANHIKKNKKKYVFYLDEDEDPFDEYVEELKEDGVWAGNLEI